MKKEISKREILKCIYLKPDRTEGVHCNVCDKAMTNDQINRCCLGFTAIYLDGDFLAQLMYGQGIHNTMVIFCNYEEINLGPIYEGPLMVIDTSCTSYVPKNWKLQLHKQGHMILRKIKK